MGVMDAVAQQSAALVEQTAAATEQVSDRMHELDHLIGYFELGAEAQQVAKNGRTPLAAMKQAHLNWRMRIANVLSGHETIADIATVRSHHACALGQWRDSEGRVLDHLPEMREMDQEHERFHQLVATAVEHAQRKDFRKVDDIMLEVEVLSTHIVQLLDNLEKKMMAHGVTVSHHHHQ